jgi:hypothetical protein
VDDSETAPASPSPIARTPAPASTPSDAPASIYQARVDALRVQIARFDRWDDAIVWARTVLFLAAAVLLVLAIRATVRPFWPAVPAVGFVIVAIVHGRVLARRDRLRAAVSWHQDGLDRIFDRWAGKGDPGAGFQAAAEAHLYAADLDLFGTGGVFELLCAARTPVGQATLAAWLQGPAPAAEARARQGAVAELAPLIDLRQDLALVATAVKEGVRDEALMAWSVRDGAPGIARLGPWRAGLAAIAVVTLAAAVLWSMGVVGPWPFVAAFVAGWMLSRRLRAAIQAITGGVDRRADELATLAALMSRLERERFRSPALAALQRALETDGLPASRRIGQLRRLVDLLEQRRNQMMGLLMAPVQATAQLALAVEAWRRTAGGAVARWMAAVGELEALSSLAGFHFEHPAYPFPEILSGTLDAAAPVFDAAALGHPLLPADRRVVNDVRLGGDLRLLVVSGSNMSGKSTLLRTVGVNAVLALAGAPVCAQRLRVTPVLLGSTLRINDSLQAGKSRFYAELTRLKQIVDRAGGAPPLLFLLDEILHGTNSHDRRIGAEAILRGLLARGAVGLVTTHDLALAQVAATMAPRAANVHFEDHLEAGVMTFDFRMKPGIVTKSNALELMRAIGLEV